MSVSPLRGGELDLGNQVTVISKILAHPVGADRDIDGIVEHPFKESILDNRANGIVLAVEAVLGRRDQPVASGFEGDLHTFDVDTATVVRETAGHAVFGGVKGIVLQAAVGASGDKEACTASTILQGDDESVAFLEVCSMLTGIVNELHLQETSLGFFNVLDIEMHDRIGLASAFLGVHTDAPPPVRLLLADLTIHFYRVVVPLVDLERK